MQGGILELGSILAAGMSSRPSDHGASIGLTEDQIVERLNEHFAMVYAIPDEPVEDFKPGEIVWLKNPAASLFKRGDQPFQFIEYLDEPIEMSHYISEPEDVYEAAAAAIVDCRIASVHCSGCESYVIRLQDSREFTRTKPTRSAPTGDDNPDGPIAA